MAVVAGHILSSILTARGGPRREIRGGEAILINWEGGKGGKEFSLSFWVSQKSLKLEWEFPASREDGDLVQAWRLLLSWWEEAHITKQQGEGGRIYEEFLPLSLFIDSSLFLSSSPPPQVCHSLTHVQTFFFIFKRETLTHTGYKTTTEC